MKKLKTFILSIAAIAMLSTAAYANGLSLNSIGSRALGMGGAFVGLANDGTAIYWNPAGLAGLNSRVYLYGTGIMPSGTYKYDAANLDMTMQSKLYFAPGVFFNYTADNMAFGLGVYVPAGLGASWDPAEMGFPASENLELMSQIGVINISPAFAYQFSDAFSIGLAFNISYATFDMKQPIAQDVTGDGIPEFFQYEESSSGMGYSATIGLKYNFSDQFSAGATFRLSSKVAMSGTAKNPLFPKLPNMPPTVAPGPGESDFDRDVTWPMWIAGGIAYRPSDVFTLVFDVQYSNWSELDKLVATYKDPYWSAALGASGDDTFTLNWKNATQIRLGGEYKFSDSFTGRLGYYFDPAPSPDETLNILFPSMTNNVITGGFTINAGNWAIEGGLEYLIASEREVEPTADNMPGKHHMNIFSFSVGVGYAFN